MSMIKKALYLGLGIFSVTREKAEKLVNELVEKGEMSGDEAKQIIDDLLTRGEEEKQALRKMVKEEIEDWRKDFSLVTRSEFESLKARIEEMQQK
ncbi:MAG: polyhydroxyalkanoate synthesis regulator [Syntrophomonadaceae bacterium]|nr:polyhydroxyalkanoate synthesis regulator [Syntrophomonadaceae bacterium]